MKKWELTLRANLDDFVLVTIPVVATEPVVAIDPVVAMVPVAVPAVDARDLPQELNHLDPVKNFVLFDNNQAAKATITPIGNSPIKGNRILLKA